ncbi:unnamed protein product [Ilex paraguariensis]|uniref:Pentatricopeptide repeat-containing protein n=1 Tax=Ilex paraguariensis TaxID=185542 RepID=A0ABC8R686_9AQUA
MRPFFHSMLNSRSKPVNSASTFISQLYIHTKHKPSQPYRRIRPPKPSPEQPGQHYPKPVRRPIPFITNLKQVQDPDAALSLFHEYHQMGFKHDYPSYASLIYKLARSRNFEAVETLLHYLQIYDIRCRETLFIALIEHYGKARLPDEAINLFYKMRSFNCARTVQSFNTLLNVLIDNGRHCDAKEMFKCSSKMGFRLNSVSFNIMIKGWLEKGEWEKACQMFNEMLEREVEPTVVTYNSKIGFLCKKGEFDKAKGLFEEMVKKGKNPNAVTYALLMENLCSSGKYKEANKMMFDMEYQGCKPRLVNYGVLTSDLCKRGKIDEAKALLVEMKKRRIKADVVMYNILINYLCKEGRAAEAYKVLVEMQVKGCEPNAATYRMMVDGFCHVGDYEGGLKVLNAMLMSRHCPRLDTFCCLIVGLFKSEKMDDACFVLEEMQKRKMRFNLESWEALVTDACDKDRAASELVIELVSAH